MKRNHVILNYNQKGQKRGKREAKRNAMDEYNYQFGGN